MVVITRGTRLSAWKGEDASITRQGGGYKQGRLGTDGVSLGCYVWALRRHSRDAQKAGDTQLRL